MNSLKNVFNPLVLVGLAVTAACGAASSTEDTGSNGESVVSCPHPDDCEPPCTVANGCLPKPPPRTCANYPTMPQCIKPPPPVYCAFSTTCAPGMYNTTTAGYKVTQSQPATTTSPAVPGSVTGCSFTPPASCETGTAGANAFPALTAPVITSVVLGANAVYGIGAPSTPLSATDKRNAVFAWGQNNNYQLGNGTTADSSTPQVPMYDPNNTIVQVAAGDEDACALVSDGSVHCWGTIMNWPGSVVWTTERTVQFPAGTKIAEITPRRPPRLRGDADAAPNGNPLVYCWGSNEYGQLGQTTNAQSYVGAPLQVPLASASISNGAAPGKVLSVVASGNSTCVLANGASPNEAQTNVYCWGDDSVGSLGDNAGTPGNISYSPVLVSGPTDGFGSPLSFSSLTGSSIGAQGYYGSFCAVASGTWYCWGADDQGQIDEPIPAALPRREAQGVNVPGILQDATIQNATLLAVGANHGCAIASGALYCFGDNDSGQLGIAAGVGSGTDFGIKAVSGSPGDLPGDVLHTSVAVGDNMTCGIYLNASNTYGTANATGNIACWGGDSGLVSSYQPALLNW